MGYTKVIQYGDITEIYSYEKQLPEKKERYQSLLSKKRAKERRKRAIRTNRSVYRARLRFFRLVHHNNLHSTSIHFLTFTFTYDIEKEKAYEKLKKFFKKLKGYNSGIPIRYISVLERTKKGRVHFHVLVYDLPPSIAGDTISVWGYNRRKRRFEFTTTTTERFTRNLQRQFNGGYLDIRVATHITEGIAGYMAKYLAKSLKDARSANERGYNCSRNIKKITVSGSNVFYDEIKDQLVDTDTLQEEKTYATMYMGTCTFQSYKNKIK